MTPIQVHPKYLSHVFPHMHHYVAHGTDIFFRELCNVHETHFFWKYFLTSNGAFFMVPDSKRLFLACARTGNAHQTAISGEEGGLISTVNALHYLSNQPFAELDGFMAKKEALLKYIHSRSNCETILKFAYF